MPGDYTRRTFNPNRDFSGVFEQQGRVRLDANLNELVDLLDRRLRSTSLDTLGRAVVPKETPDGFKIFVAANGDISIGPGRAYVDGILVDNHGRDRNGFVAPAFDHHLEEKRGTGNIAFERQPYMPRPQGPVIKPAGRFLAYLDVRNRELTWVEEPALLDSALYGVDTATRRQIVWQVKLHPLQGPVTCETPDAQIPGWDAVIRPSGSRLTTGAVGVPASTDPCVIPPNGGYRGVENRLYRVEIHGGGGFGAATFKWSRDNGSLAAPVTTINGTELGIVRPGRDQVVRFATGDWVEVTDDDHELAGLAGEMTRVQSVDDARGVLVLTAPLTGSFNTADPLSVQTRVRRWDEKPAATGVLSVINAPVVLEDGVQVTFALDAAIPGAVFKPLENWVFAARVADASVEQLFEAPPNEPHHHIVRLAVLDTTNRVPDDCREIWPHDCEDCCECDACVTADSHNSGAFTIQDAVDRVGRRGGKICLGTGIFRLKEPVRISRASSLRVQGKGWKTIVVPPGAKPAFIIERSTQVTIQDLTVIGLRDVVGAAPGLFVQPTSTLAQLGGSMAIGITTTVGTTIERCFLITSPLRQDGLPTIATAGAVIGLSVRDCAIVGEIGIGNPYLDDRTPGGPIPTMGPATPVGPALARATAASSATATTVGPPTVVAGSGVSISASASATRPATVATPIFEEGVRPQSSVNAYFEGRLLAARWDIRDNIIVGRRAGVALLGPVINALDNRLVRNDILTLTDAGIAVTGLTLAGTLDVDDNVIASGGYGILTGVDEARITGNTVVGFTGVNLGPLVALLVRSQGDKSIYPAFLRGDDLEPAQRVTNVAAIGLPRGVQLHAGIAVISGLGFDSRMRGVRIVGNDVTAITGYGIACHAPVRSLLVDANRVDAVMAGGIVCVGIRTLSCVISDNVVEGVIGRDVIDKDEFAANWGRSVTSSFGLVGIAVAGCEESDVRDNQVRDVRAENGRGRGIALDAVARGRVTANRLRGIGLAGATSLGITIEGPFGNAEVRDNEVLGDAQEDGSWQPIRIRGFFETQGAAVPVNRSIATKVAVVSGKMFLFGSGSKIHVIKMGPETAAVRGNTIEGGGVAASLRVSPLRGNLMVSDNRCHHRRGQREAAFELSALSAILNANYIELDDKGLAIDALVDPQSVTVLGNITNGIIRIQGVALAAPWPPLNVELP